MSTEQDHAPAPATESEAAGSETSGQETPQRRGVSRRGLFGLAGAGVALAGVGAAAGYAVSESQSSDDGVVPFRDTHQAGIVTPAQDRLHFVALDLTTTDKAAVQDLLRRWTRPRSG